MAGLAVLVAVELEGLFAAVGGLLKGNFQLIPQVVALLGALAAGRSAHAAAEQLVENIAHAAHAAKVEAPRPAEGIAIHAGSVKAKLVVPGALVRVGQHLVGLVQLLEAGLGLLVVGVQVGVALLGLAAVGALDVLVGGVFVNAQHLVIVAFVCQCDSPRNPPGA